MAEAKNQADETAKEDKKATVATTEATSDVKEFYDKKGAQSLENIAKGGKPVEVNLTNKTLVEFTEDYGHFLKGHTQEVSDVAFEIYNGKGVIKKL